MKTKNKRKVLQKFDIEKFDVAKLKNLHLIVGGGIGKDPIDTNHQNKNDNGASSNNCNK